MKLQTLKSLRSATRHKEEALKAREIVQNTFATDRQNAIRVHPADLKTTSRGWNIATITKEPGKRARQHLVRVFLPAHYHGKFSKCNEIKVDCDCGRYQFVWNWALLQKNAAIKDRTNGAAPDVTNPDYSPGCCKHALVAIKTLLSMDPNWPAATVGKSGHEREGKPVTLSTLRSSSKHLHLHQRYQP